MKAERIGKTIRIPVNAQPGPFNTECLVTFESMDGPVSGFVRAEQIIDSDGRKFIEAAVVKSEDGLLSVRLRGSFFTTTGLAHIKEAA
jgi:hypothetical protein